MINTLELLGDIFKNKLNLARSATDYQTMIARLDTYNNATIKYGKTGLASVFAQNIGSEIMGQAYVIEYELELLIDQTYLDMRNKLIRKSQGRSSGCGCTSAIACISVISALLVVI